MHTHTHSTHNTIWIFSIDWRWQGLYGLPCRKYFGACNKTHTGVQCAMHQHQQYYYYYHIYNIFLQVHTSTANSWWKNSVKNIHRKYKGNIQVKWFRREIFPFDFTSATGCPNLHHLHVLLLYYAHNRPSNLYQTTTWVLFSNFDFASFSILQIKLNWKF